MTEVINEKEIVENILHAEKKGCSIVIKSTLPFKLFVLLLDKIHDSGYIETKEITLRQFSYYANTGVCAHYTVDKNTFGAFYNNKI